MSKKMQIVLVYFGATVDFQTFEPSVTRTSR